MNAKTIGWEMVEEIGISIPNPRSVGRMPIPPGLSPQQLANIEAEIDRINAEADARFKAEQAELENLP